MHPEDTEQPLPSAPGGSEPEETRDQELPPTTEFVNKQLPRVRILVIGKSGIGKSSLINGVFKLKEGDANAAVVMENKPGVHNIEHEITSESNDRVVLHDSEGFEAGDVLKLKVVRDFIERRTDPSLPLDKRLHTIWVCAQVPASGDRLFETGIEELLKNSRKIRVPVIVVFTKVDILQFKIRRDLSSKLTGDELERQTQVELDKQVQQQCVLPLENLKASIKFHAVVSTKTQPESLEALVTRTVQALNTPGELGRFRDQFSDRVKAVFGGPSTGKIVHNGHHGEGWTSKELVSSQMAAAQRVNPDEKFTACVLIGRKRYWRALLSEAIIGFSVAKVLRVLHRDIVNVWNIEDTHELLMSSEFMALIQDLAGTIILDDTPDAIKQKAKEIQESQEMTLGKQVVVAVVEGAQLFVSLPLAAIIVIGEWVIGTHRRTKASMQGLVAFIVDLVLIMDVIFHLVKKQGTGSVNKALINSAMRSYASPRCSTVHRSIQTWVKTHWDRFTHMKADLIVDKIKQLILENRLTGENDRHLPAVERVSDGEDQEAWIASKELLEPVVLQLTQ